MNACVNVHLKSGVSHLEKYFQSNPKVIKFRKLHQAVWTKEFEAVTKHLCFTILK